MTTAIEFQVTLDCEDPHELAAWWAEALGSDFEPTDEAFIRQMVEVGTRVVSGRWASGPRTIGDAVAR